jgi:hypothetical protein
MKVILSIVFVIMFVSCNVHKIDRPDAPSCCQRLYDILYLSQKLSQPPNIDKEMDCCRIQDKIDYCEKKENKDQCYVLMKTF